MFAFLPPCCPQVSATHRLEDNKDEVARCLAAGCEVAPSTVDGKPAGPIRCVLQVGVDGG